MSSITVVQDQTETGLTIMELAVQQDQAGMWSVAPGDTVIPAGFDGHLRFTIASFARVTFNTPVAIVFPELEPQPSQEVSPNGKVCMVTWKNTDTPRGTQVGFAYDLSLNVVIDPTVTNDGPP
jgi:hypothetical protein